jgi:P-type Cu+ transporter
MELVQITNNRASSPPFKDKTTGTFRLRVSGMTCAGCAVSIQRALEATPNVTSASVSFIAGTAEVEGHGLLADSLIGLIRQRGFNAESIVSEAPLELTSIEEQQQANERTWRYRALVGMILWVPLEVLHWSSHAMHWHGEWMTWLMFVGSSIILVFVGSEFYKSAWMAAKNRTTNMDTLIALGATTAFAFSALVMLMKWDLPMYFAEASGLLGVVSLGHWFEARASAKAGSAVRELLSIQPETAELLESNGASKIIPNADVPKGVKLIIRPGSRIGVDGIVVDGQSEVDQSVITGESSLIDKRIGDSVVAGSINSTGRLVIETTVDGRNTTISRIASLVQKAQASRAPIQRLADQISSIFVPTVLSIALLTFIGWWIGGDIAKGLISAVTVLIISCPCALGLATPMAVMVGTGAASKRGILIRNAETLERIGRANQIVFDKTGTLTRGLPLLTSIKAADSVSASELLRLAASVEFPSEHPIAKAIVGGAKSQGLKISPVTEFSTIPGKGVRGYIDGRLVWVERDDVETARVIRDGDFLGTLTLSDELRPDAIEAVNQLKQMGMDVSMLTGDHQSAAQRIGKELGLCENKIVANASPASKLEYIASRNSNVMMVGDGINDAAALATAGVGIALASGTNVAVEAASVVIPGDRVAAVPELITLARKSLATIKQNLFFAFFYNAVAIPAAALGFLGESGPLWAALAMGLSDITVVGNALRLKRSLERNILGSRSKAT